MPADGLIGSLAMEARPLALAAVFSVAGLLVFGVGLRLTWRAWRHGLLQKELTHFFLSPIAWLAQAGFVLLNGFVVLFLLHAYQGRPNEPFVEVLFGGYNAFFWMLQLIVAPALAMRLVAEERASGTLEVLLTAPVSEGEVVMAKFLAALCAYLALWVPVLFLVGVVFSHAAPPETWGQLAAAGALGPSGWGKAWGILQDAVDAGPLLAAVLGTTLLGAAWLSISLLASSFCRNQVVAFIAAFSALLILFSLGLLPGLMERDPAWLPGLRDALRFASFPTAFSDFPRGVIDTRRVVYLLTWPALCLYLTVRAVERLRWR